MASAAGIPSGPARNRVTPLGDIQAMALRGALTGNRGILHAGREIVRFHAHNSWVTCALSFNGRWHEQFQPGHFTWLYFHDEAVAFAAGHRPCAECRRVSYQAYQAAWAARSGVGVRVAGIRPSAQEMNRQLHAERLVRGTHRRRFHVARWRELPPGAFVICDGTPHLVTDRGLTAWSTAGYGATVPRPSRGEATLITPPSTVAVLAAGYDVHIDPSALGPVSE